MSRPTYGQLIDVCRERQGERLYSWLLQSRIISLLALPWYETITVEFCVLGGTDEYGGPMCVMTRRHRITAMPDPTRHGTETHALQCCTLMDNRALKKVT